jgi:hypothetical protein
MDPSSIEVNRRARRAKTDRIDLEKLMRTLLAYLRGEPRVCSMVHLPAVHGSRASSRTPTRPSHPASNVRDDRETPLLIGGRMHSDNHIFLKNGSKIFGPWD